MEDARQQPENSPETIKKQIESHLRYSLGKTPDEASIGDIYAALAYCLRDRLMDRMLATRARFREAGAKRLSYLSLEFLIGPSLGRNMLALGIREACEQAVAALGLNINDVEAQEADPALGNGGLGRLAACFLESLATLNMPGYGYGIHYDYGLFRQEIRNGYQIEKPDQWALSAAPLQVQRLDHTVLVPLYGRIEHFKDRWEGYNPSWLDWQVVLGVPYDIPNCGYGGDTVTYLRLFTAQPSKDFDIRIFNQGDYFAAMEQKIDTEKISKILYPSDLVQSGKELRLTQEYFLVACALKDIVRRHLDVYGNISDFDEKNAIQLNDTHPSLAIAELMRILVDEQWMDWEPAWDITKKTFAYTNHTLLPEALETWPAGLLGYLLPRHMQIIEEINHRFLEQAIALYPDDRQRLARLSIFEEGQEKMVRMANLAIVGSHSVNGVSALHTELVKTRLMPDFFDMWPEKFNAKTNGITPRRWLQKANPGLTALLARHIGPDFVADMEKLSAILPLAGDAAFAEEFLKVKRANKVNLLPLLHNTAMIKADPDALFDIQAKRIHEYKRQLLNILGIMADYLALVEDGEYPASPFVALFAGKAAPGYTTAKKIIKMIHCVAEVINNDKRTRGAIQVGFVPDFRVSIAERLVAAADLSEQISTAGYEASGTGNMKFAANGALTIGTLDGANIEIEEKVGGENLFIFGLDAEQVADMCASKAYRPREIADKNPELARVMDALKSDRFCPGEPGLLEWVWHYLYNENDPYLHLADFASYCKTRRQARADYADSAGWAGKAICNVARMGWFSSDRTIREYASQIWNIAPLTGLDGE
ncbi:MAG: glycogen/starch/alpha-glucan phosphorylase [Desulfatibacillaceae bacterium]|nr:glycogen/starch/alpha-glucan phosphorylase [Desulfatibacillaceae bacterium]